MLRFTQLRARSRMSELAVRIAFADAATIGQQVIKFI